MPDTNGSENFQNPGLRAEVRKQPIVFIEVFSLSFMFRPGSEGNTKKLVFARGNEGLRNPHEPT